MNINLMSLDNVALCFSRWEKLNPRPTTELIYKNEFELLIAVILSAQATDKSVNIATAKLFPIANTPEALLELGQENLEKYIKNIGLYKNKAANIIKTCAMILQFHDGKVPRQREQLEALAGVGRKTANVVLNTAFGEATMAVDTHVFRVANRTGIGAGKNPLQVEKSLMERIPSKFMINAHHHLILHGRYICTARKAKCDICPIADLCLNPPEKS